MKLRKKKTVVYHRTRTGDLELKFLHKMLSNDTVKIIKLSVVLAKYSLILPVSWNSTYGTITRRISGWKKWIGKTITSTCLLSLIMVVFVIGQNLVNKVSSASGLIFGLFLISLMSMVALAYIVMLLRGTEVMLLLNSLLALNRQIGKTIGAIY